MTRDEILEMGEGWKINELIHTRIMGADILPRGYGYPWYSEDIESAWRVVEKMAEKGISSYVGINAANKNWEATFGTNDLEYTLNKVASEISAPLAICRAALLAVMEDK